MTLQRPGITIVTFALEEEARPFRPLATNLPGVKILVTGVGSANAEKSIHSALREISPGLVISCGYAGALVPELHIGDLVFDCAPGTPLFKHLVSLRARPIKFFFSPKIFITAEQKRKAFLDYGAQAVEMESSFILSVCKERGILNATLRSISDLSEEDLPIDFNLMMKQGQQINRLKVLWAALKTPAAIPALIRLRSNSRLAAKSLAQGLFGLLRSMTAALA